MSSPPCAAQCQQKEVSNHLHKPGVLTFSPNVEIPVFCSSYIKYVPSYGLGPKTGISHNFLVCSNATTELEIQILF